MIPVNAILTVMAVITLVVSVYLNQKGTGKLTAQVVEAPESMVLSEQSETTATPTPSATPSATVSPSTPTPTPTSTPNVDNSVTTEDISSFIYPGASISIYTSSRLTLTSTEPHQQIIDWYKNKIKQLSFSAKSVAQTSTNGKIVAKMSAARNELSVNISINKESNSNNVAIEVILTK